MRHVATSRPAELVWDFLADFTTEQWDPPTRQTRRTAGDGGVGTVYRNGSHLFGVDAPVTYTVVDHEPPRRLRLRGDAGRVQFLDTIEVHDVRAGRARVDYTVQFDVRGAARVLTPLAVLAMRRVADDAARQMGRVLDEL